MNRLPKYLRRRNEAEALMHMSVPPLMDGTEYEFFDQDGEAVQAMMLTPEMVTVISVWSSSMPVIEHDALDHDVTYVGLNVPTNSGPKRASQGDYVVKLTDGSFDIRKAHQLKSMREA